MFKKLTGCVLMIIGTAVGAGMLALPIATAHANIETTLLMMVFSWALMTLGALALLEATLWFPAGANLVSMVKATTGKGLQSLAILMYLLLLYSLICAYLAGTGDILKGLISSLGFNLPQKLTTLLGLLLAGTVVILGVRAVDLTNRGLMSIKLLAYIILVLAICPHISLPHLTEGQYVYQTSTLMVVITSFGFANLIPTLCNYLKGDATNLRRVILIGSTSALVIYLAWILCVQGLLPRGGQTGLLSILHASDPNSLLLQGISAMVHSNWVSGIAKVFVSICALTSFLGVSLSLADFIADGLQCKKQGWDGVKVHALTFLPPFIVVLFFPGIFIKALSYAGFCCIFLLILLPIMLVYRGRYQKKLSGAQLLPGGKFVLCLAGLIALLLLALQLKEYF